MTDYDVDEWDNLRFDAVFRQMLLKRLDKQNELLEQIVELMK